MKIAGISLTYNDGYKLNEWKCHFDEYKAEVDIYIIVDNGSDADYLRDLIHTFGEEAIIIQRTSNGGCTAAYNDGIRYALNNTDADAITIIGNDIRLSHGCLNELYNYLYNDSSLGIVSAIMLYINSHIVEDFGHTLDGLKVCLCDNGKKIETLPKEERYTDLVAGGFYMAKREFYDKVGLQDEKLFMYGDEVDTSIRAKQAGFMIGITSKVHVWHWHINDPILNTRKPASEYLMARNRVYLARKHFGKGKEINAFITFGLKQCLLHFFAGIIRKDKIRFEKAKYCFEGALHGLRNDMTQNKYTKF